MVVARQVFMALKENALSVRSCNSFMFTQFPSDLIHDFLERIVPVESPLFEENDIKRILHS